MKTIKVIDIFNLVDQLQQENSELKRKLELKSGLVLARQNIEFCNENIKLQQEKEDLIKWLEDKKNEYYSSDEDNIIKNITLTQVLNKLKGDDKEC